MKPTNSDSTGCDPMSSNCVIWQGPDLECINLCKGDSVTVVVHKLAEELCKVLDILNISSYDTACFNLAECSPADFTALIQLIIDKVCAQEGIAPTEGAAATGCPDCEVTVCTDFYFTNPQGDQVTTMQLKDYVLAIGNRVCSLTAQITTLNNSLAQQDVRLTTLENAPPPVLNLPNIVPVCVLPAIQTDIDVVLAAVEQQFCELRTYTGDSTTILLAIQKACLGLNAANQLSSTGIMSDLPDWHSTPTSMAQSFSNLWQTVCDLRSAVQSLQLNCCDTGCSSIDLDIAAVLLSPTELQLTFSGTLPSNFVDDPAGSSISVIDAAGGGPQVENAIFVNSAHLDIGSPYVLNLVGVNGAIDLNVTFTYRFLDQDTGSTCQSVSQFTVLGTDSCPDLILVPDYLGINYSFAWNGTIPIAVVMELYDSTGTGSPEQTIPLNITTSNPSGEFLGLDEGTTYQIGIRINGVLCPLESFVTLEYPCLAATLNAPTIDYTDPEGDQTGSTIVAWQATYGAATHPTP